MTPKFAAISGSTLLTAGLCLCAATTGYAQQEAAPAATPPAAPVTAPAQPAAKLHYTDDYRINVNHDAASDGEIIFRVTPKGGEAKEVKVAIKKGTNENSVAHAIKKAFIEQIGTKKNSVEMEDGENVIIERSVGGKDYALELVSSTVNGVKITIHKD
jgi:hypothetical protein